MAPAAGPPVPLPGPSGQLALLRHIVSRLARRCTVHRRLGATGGEPPGEALGPLCQKHYAFGIVAGDSVGDGTGREAPPPITKHLGEDLAT